VLLTSCFSSYISSETSDILPIHSNNTIAGLSSDRTTFVRIRANLAALHHLRQHHRHRLGPPTCKAQHPSRPGHHLRGSKIASQPLK
ncbi:hypothetical protein DOTSEDRAFT_67828, partial [Dothistroma septosporum NZE10]